MRRFVIQGLMLTALLGSSSGCFVNMYSADPLRRYQQLFFQSQDLALLEDDWNLFWQIDRPSYLSWKIYNGFGRPAARRPRFNMDLRGPEDDTGYPQR